MNYIHRQQKSNRAAEKHISGNRLKQNVISIIIVLSVFTIIIGNPIWPPFIPKPNRKPPAPPPPPCGLVINEVDLSTI